MTFCLCMLVSMVAQAKEGDEKIRVACVGNSITYGYLLNNPFQQAFPGVLQQFLGTGYEVRNFVYSARTMLKKGDLP